MNGFDGIPGAPGGPGQQGPDVSLHIRMTMTIHL